MLRPAGIPSAKAAGRTRSRSRSRAHRWQELLDSGKYPSISALTCDLKVDFGYVSRLLQLTLLAPDIIGAILDGDAPSGVSLDKLQWRLPLLWSEQRALIEGLARTSQRSPRRTGAHADADTHKGQMSGRVSGATA